MLFVFVGYCDYMLRGFFLFNILLLCLVGPVQHCCSLEKRKLVALLSLFYCICAVHEHLLTVALEVFGRLRSVFVPGPRHSFYQNPCCYVRRRMC